MTGQGLHLRYDAARRRAVARASASPIEDKLEIARAARAAERRHHRGGLPGLLAGRPRGGVADRARGARADDRGPRARRASATSTPCWEAVRGARDAAHPRLPLVQRHPHGAPAAQEQRRRDRDGARRCRARRRYYLATSSSRRWTPRARTPSSSTRCSQAAIEEGATTINIPDTVGYAVPAEFGELIARRSASSVPGIDKARISVHCHNDLGMATANSLAGVLNGARQVEGAINGIGERAGNTSHRGGDHGDRDAPGLPRRAHRREHARAVPHEPPGGAPAPAWRVQSNKAIVGKNAFRHSSGIHQDGVLKMRETYEIMDPADSRRADGLVDRADEGVRAPRAARAPR